MTDPTFKDRDGLERWGYRHDHGTHIQLDDGFWTPWHIADAELARLRAENEALREAVGFVEQKTCSYCAAQVVLMGSDFIQQIAAALDQAGAPKQSADGGQIYGMFDRIRLLGETK